MAKPANSLPIGTQRPKGNGYWEIKAPHHPLAYSGNGRSGWVIRHRMMWYDHVQGEEQHCHDEAIGAPQSTSITSTK